MDGNYIHACLKSLRGRGRARKGCTHNDCIFPVCIGKVGECVSIKCEGGDFVLFLCAYVCTCVCSYIFSNIFTYLNTVVAVLYCILQLKPVLLFVSCRVSLMCAAS